MNEIQAYHDNLKSLSKTEVLKVKDQWKEAGYVYAPTLLKTLESLEVAVDSDLGGKAHILFLERDMNPLQVAADTKKAHEHIQYSSIPASSAVFTQEIRNEINSAVSLAANLSESKWNEVNKMVDDDVDSAIEDLIRNQPGELLAFCRDLLKSLEISKDLIPDEQILEILKGERGGLDSVTHDPIILFDSQFTGTYIEITRNILNKLFPQVSVHGIMLNTYNPRLGTVTSDGIGDFESLPKGYDILFKPNDGTILKGVRPDPRGTWAFGFKLGLIAGIEHLETDQYEHTATMPIINPSHSEKQWEGDFGGGKQSLDLKLWQVNQVHIGDFRKKTTNRD